MLSFLRVGMEEFISDAKKHYGSLKYFINWEFRLGGERR